MIFNTNMLYHKFTIIFDYTLMERKANIRYEIKKKKNNNEVIMI